MPDDYLSNYLPQRVNQGPWVTAYTLPRLGQREPGPWVLPICSLATSYERLAELGDRLLPPLFHEALDEPLKREIVERIAQCFPSYDPQRQGEGDLQVVELPRGELPASPRPRVLAFSVDTAVEEHGPHLPLATDTIQSYGALRRVAERLDGLSLARPVEYGQLTWGLPFGFSVDLTAELLRQYVAGYARAVDRWLAPEALYVVDVHGSIVHRRAIVEGLRDSGVGRWAFRWLHEPLAEFASQRGDQHAGGVETAMVEQVSPDLLDRQWWPERIEELAASQMSFETAVELTPDLPAFTQHVEQHRLNGIVGDILNYRRLDGALLMERVVELAREDVELLLAGDSPAQGAGENLW